MNDFSKFMEKDARPEPNFGGSFDCQTCGEEVYEAYRDVQAKVLLWWCSQGHLSVIEKFVF